MSGATIVFYLLSTVAVLMAAGTVFARNPVHAALFLVISFLNVAGLYVMLGAEFLAAVQVIVYTGAILVLFLFVIMLVRPENVTELSHTAPIQAGISWLLGIGLFAELATVIVTGVVTGQRARYSGADLQALCGLSGQQPQLSLEQVQQLCGNTQLIGRVLYSRYLLPFEVASLVLLVAVIAAVVLGLPDRVAQVLGRDTISISLAYPQHAGLLEGPTAGFDRLDADRDALDSGRAGAGRANVASDSVTSGTSSEVLR